LWAQAQSPLISGDTGLFDIKQLAENNDFPEVVSKGSVSSLDSRPAYVRHLLGYIDKSKLKPLKIVSNPGNGGAGTVLDRLEKELPFEFIKVHHQPDGNFPNGIPNPLEPDNRGSTIDAVKKYGADMGIAWDGDFDRCFFFDENGRYYIVGMLAEAFLAKNAGSKIIYDPRLTWNTQDLVERSGGVAIQSKTGHAFIKERMRLEDAVYGGEMSAHHYFRGFAYCDSGMIPWLLVAELLNKTGKPLSQLVDDRMEAFPCSGEINSTVADPKALLSCVESFYKDSAVSIEHIDGLSISFDDWRFNLRMSNTEPVVRLNVESRANISLMEQRRDELLSMIRQP